MDNKSPDDLSKTIVKIVNERKPQTVKELVTLLKEEHHAIEEEQILETILGLQSQGKIKLENPPQRLSQKPTKYIKTNQALWYWATMAMAIVTAALVFAIPEDFYPWVYVRYALGTVFVLWLPGYSFIKALFPTQVPIKMSTENLDGLERIALSLGMSLVLVPIVGLLLNYTPWGIRLTPIVLSLLALTVVFATVAIIREHQIRTRTPM